MKYFRSSKASVEKALTWILLLLLIVLAAATIYVATGPRIGEKFTEFYILGPSGKAYGYPTNLTVGESGTVIIGVVNHEYEEVAYRIAVLFNNETMDVIEGIVLKHGGVWEREYTFTLLEPVKRAKLEFILYREGFDEPYRTLHLWVTVRPRE